MRWPVGRRDQPSLDERPSLLPPFLTPCGGWRHAPGEVVVDGGVGDRPGMKGEALQRRGVIGDVRSKREMGREMKNLENKMK